MNRSRMRRRIFTVPNQLTFLRLGFLPLFLIAVLYARYDWALGLLVVAALTDGMDGLLARTLNQKTAIGAYLDPIADKLLLSGMFATLWLARLIHPWLALAVLGRDLLILLAAAVFYLARLRRDFPPSVWGKASTFIQIVFLCFRLGELNGIPVHFEVVALEWMVAGLVAISTLDYAWRIRAPHPAGGASQPH